MKSLLLSHALGIAISVAAFSGHAQATYVYPLENNFKSIQAEAPDLVQMPNDAGQSGEFISREVPRTSCGHKGRASGYFFEDNAGLQFNNPDGFIGETYSISFNFQVDEFISPPSWVRILSFTHTDDAGIHILLTRPPYNGTLEFWPFGTVGRLNYFSPDEMYQMILVRNENGLIKVYVNGAQFAEYDDSETRIYLPHPPNNYVVWFRDYPKLGKDEASPGFVSGIELSNFPWTKEEVMKKWEEFCSE